MRNILFILLFFLYNCGAEDSNISQKDPAIHLSDSLITLDIQGGLLRTANQMKVQLVEEGVGDFLVFGLTKSATYLQKVNLETGKLATVPLPNEGPYAIDRVFDFIWVNSDSIFVFAREGILLLNETGAIISYKRYRPWGLDIQGDSTFFLEADQNFYFGENLYMGLHTANISPDYYPLYYKSPIFGQLSLRDYQLAPLPIHYPTSHDAYYGFLSRSRHHVLAGDRLLYGFGYSPDIHSYQLRTAEQVSYVLPVPTKAVLNEAYRGSNGAGDELAEHAAMSTHYQSLFYDPVNQITYRAVSTPGEKPRQIKYAIIAYNKDFQMIGEIPLPKWHTLNPAFVRNGYLYIRYTMDEKENQLVFKRIGPD